MVIEWYNSEHCKNWNLTWAVVVAQLVEPLLQIPEVHSSNPVMGKKLCWTFTVNCIEKTKIKKKRGREWPILKKNWNLLELCDVVVTLVTSKRRFIQKLNENVLNFSPRRCVIKHLHLSTNEFLKIVFYLEMFSKVASVLMLPLFLGNSWAVSPAANCQPAFANGKMILNDRGPWPSDPEVVSSNSSTGY